MKLNEKHLSAFATCDSVSDKEGWLLKKGEINKSFQKRWFVLKGNLLFYFERKTDKDPIGVIILEGFTVELAENTEAYAFEIAFQGPGTRTYVLAAESQQEMESWMRTITCSSYEFMKLMISEMHKQLDEINSREKKTSGTEKTKNQIESNNLIDFGENSTANPRQNPFNTNLSEQSGSFVENPFKTMVEESMQARTFLQMHTDFGTKIVKS